MLKRVCFLFVIALISIEEAEAACGHARAEKPATEAGREVSSAKSADKSSDAVPAEAAPSEGSHREGRSPRY